MKKRMCEFEPCSLGILSLTRKQTFSLFLGFFVLSFFLPIVSDGTKVNLLST